MRLYVELDSGRVYNRRDMCRILESCYDFDEFTPMSEAWEHKNKGGTQK